LEYTDIAWTKLVNMVFLEQPAGVGFSYSNDPADYNTNDTRSAEDNYAFLLGFLELFPEYVGRDLWLTGESYGGVYVPYLSSLILSGSSQSLIDQFKGFMIGNPVICTNFDYRSVQLNIFYWHGLVSYINFKNFSDNGCDKGHPPSEKVCNEITRTIIKEIGIIDQELKAEEVFGLALSDNTHPISIDSSKKKEKNLPSLDPDDLYQDFCTGNGTLEFSLQDPAHGCKAELGDVLTNYLNNPAVQTAINAKPTTWSICTSNINYTTNVQTTIPFYQGFFSSNPSITIMIYSGDVDVATVPFGVSQRCLAELNRPVTSHWQPWFVNGETAGYVEVFDKYTYATVKGAGHEVPTYQPYNAFAMFERFLTSQSLSSEAETAKARKLMGSKRSLKQKDLLRKHGLSLF